MYKKVHPIFDRILTKDVYENKNKHAAKVFWFTGLSGSGKSTIAENVERQLFEKDICIKVIDGDNTRTGLCSDLTFSLEDRMENIRRVAELSKLFIDSGFVTLNSFISPTEEIRNRAKKIIGGDNFYEIFIDTPIEICEKRDVKGLYKKARSGEIEGFTGIDSSFESPKKPSLHIKTENQSIQESVDIVKEFILGKIRI